MKLFKFARKIRTEEDGAVTVDWVVLTAAVVGMGAVALTAIRSNTEGLATKIGEYVADQDVAATTPPANP